MTSKFQKMILITLFVCANGAAVAHADSKVATVRCDSPSAGSFNLQVAVSTDGLPSALLSVERLNGDGSVFEVQKAKSYRDSDLTMNYFDVATGTMYFRIPTTQVDWSQHASECYVQSAAPGLWAQVNWSNLSSGLASLIVTKSANPRMEVQGHVHFGTVVYEETLDGRTCHGNLAMEANEPLNCQMINNMGTVVLPR